MATRSAIALGVIGTVALCCALELRAVGIAQTPVVGPTGIAVLDVGEIIQHHFRLQQQLGKLNVDVRQAEEGLKRSRAEIDNSAQRGRDLRAGSPERKSLDDEMLRRQAELEATFSIERKAFYERESQIYCAAAAELNETVRRYADRHGIRLVLRISKATVDGSNRESVLSDINKEVVFSRDGDITAEILAELNREAPR